MANEQQFKVRTLFVATRSLVDYQASIPEWVRSGDSVLELGCADGATTRLLSERAGAVIGTDVTKGVVQQARERHPDLRFEQLDPSDVRSAIEFAPRFDVVYFDLAVFSGYRALLDLIAWLTMYATVLRPRAIVVKSSTLKHFCSQCHAWKSPTDGVPTRRVRPSRGLPEDGDPEASSASETETRPRPEGVGDQDDDQCWPSDQC